MKMLFSLKKKRLAYYNISCRIRKDLVNRSYSNIYFCENMCVLCYRLHKNIHKRRHQSLGCFESVFECICILKLNIVQRILYIGK